jgi:excisionase family DNA binding protein
MTTASSHQPNEALERKVYTPQDVATLLGVSKEHVHRQIRAGLMPHKRVGRRVVIPCELFEAWLMEPEKG